jgi:phospholipid-binding lipoprotein MlaA
LIDEPCLVVQAGVPAKETIVPDTNCRSWIAVVIAAIVSISFLGCGVQRKGSVEGDAQLSDVAPSPVVEGESQTADAAEGMDYDPWERFNERTFWFNFDVMDRYALKPAATVWAKIPQPARQGLANAFDNLEMPKRLVNEVFQVRYEKAGSEVARFLLNTTVGVAGFVDVASRAGLKKNDADTGQTLGVYGAGPGPYLVVPLLPPLTVRDGIGYAADSLLDPLSWFVTPFAVDFGRAAGKTVNERAANLKLYQDVEDTSLYGAVRNGYLQRRQKSIEGAIRQRDKQLGSESFLARYTDQRAATVTGTNDGSARTAQNQGQVRP